MNIIVTVDKNFGIGNENEKLFDIKEDKEHFDELTKNKVVVMGRNTFEAMDRKPLEKRINICLSVDKKLQKEGIIVVGNLDELFEKLSFYNTDNIFVIGGAEVYKQLLPYCKYAFVTKVEETKEADARFPKLDKYHNWKFLGNSDPYFVNNTIFCFGKYENKHVQKYNYGYEKDDDLF